MIVRTIGLGAACLALAANAIMIPSTVSMPGRTPESIDRQQDDDEFNIGDLSWISYGDPGDEGNYGHVTWKVDDVKVAHAYPGSDEEDDYGYYDYEDYEAEYWDEEMPELIRVEWDFDDEEMKDATTFWFPDDDDEDSERIPSVEACPTGSSPKAIFCRIRSMISGKFDEVKPYFTGHRRPCPKKLAELAKAKADEFDLPKIHGGIPKFWNTFHPGEPMPQSPDNSHGKHHHNHHYHHHMSKFSRILRGICSGLRSFVTSFLIPILIGIAAGMTASLVGMCVGTALAWLWIKFVRGGKRGNARSNPADEIVIVSGEKDGLLELDAEATEVEAPPVYIERE